MYKVKCIRFVKSRYFMHLFTIPSLHLSLARELWSLRLDQAFSLLLPTIILAQVSENKEVQRLQNVTFVFVSFLSHGALILVENAVVWTGIVCGPISMVEILLSDFHELFCVTKVFQLTANILSLFIQMLQSY